ncbi:hypothetical protein Ga0466249_004550 [Sporomusaceae bacterium BoRhaA]|uniref:hypothetical protein n=1 Tax=Pelorhabdus rhamnosifermentans TaxID=2772457 RepID=UPI001C05FAF5|nr:hypothetical protein [Pelorhabdus rhamnosifermentans]MBU2703405.1 hypothetical protein [Pelorhabdus rhamnosifermentans]
MFNELQEREFGLLSVLSTAWSVYCQRFRAILIITLIVYIPTNIIEFFILMNVEKVESYMKFVMNLEMFIGVIACMGIAIIVEKAVKNEDVDWKTALSQSFASWNKCVVTNLSAGLRILGWTLLLIVPGIIWFIYYYFVTQIVALRGISGIKVLDYSKALVKERWWRTFEIIVAIIIATIVISCVKEYLLGTLCNMFSESCLGLDMLPDWLFDILPDWLLKIWPAIFSVFFIICETVENIIDAFFTVAVTVLFLNLDYITKININELNSELPGEMDVETCEAKI